MLTLHTTTDSADIAEATAKTLRKEGRQAGVVESVVWNVLVDDPGDAPVSERYVVAVEV
jgi:hypothetical protein